METYYVYILLCKGGALYTGITPDLKRRISIHYQKAPGCAKFTRSNQVEEVKMVWKTASKSAALKAEHYIKKKLKRAEKLDLIQNPSRLDAIFAEDGLSFLPLPQITLKECIAKESEP